MEDHHKTFQMAGALIGVLINTCKIKTRDSFGTEFLVPAFTHMLVDYRKGMEGSSSVLDIPL